MLYINLNGILYYSINMDSELYVKELKEAYITYLNSINGRKNLYSRAKSAIINANSKTKKLSLTIIREIFEDKNNICCLFLNDKEISIKLIELLRKGIQEEIEFHKFISEFLTYPKLLNLFIKFQNYIVEKKITGENAFIFFYLKKNLKMNILIVIHLLLKKNI